MDNKSVQKVRFIYIFMVIIYLKEQIKMLVYETIGIKVEIGEHISKYINEPVSLEDHEKYEAIRKNRLTSKEIPKIQIDRLKKENNKLRETIEILENLLLEKL